MPLFRCRFVDRLEEVPRDYLTIVGTKKAVQEINQERIDALDDTIPFIRSISVDEIRPLTSSYYSAASEHISEEMNKSHLYNE